MNFDNRKVRFGYNIEEWREGYRWWYSYFIKREIKIIEGLICVIIFYWVEREEENGDIDERDFYLIL